MSRYFGGKQSGWMSGCLCDLPLAGRRFERRQRVGQRQSQFRGRHLTETGPVSPIQYASSGGRHRRCQKCRRDRFLNGGALNRHLMGDQWRWRTLRAQRRFSFLFNNLDQSRTAIRAKPQACRSYFYEKPLLIYLVVDSIQPMERRDARSQQQRSRSRPYKIVCQYR